MNDGLWTDSHNRNTYTQIKVINGSCYQVVSMLLQFIISSSRHHKQLQRRTGCPELGSRKRCLIIQVSFPDLGLGMMCQGMRLSSYN